jgi:hypothetical protein
MEGLDFFPLGHCIIFCSAQWSVWKKDSSL